MNYLENMHLCVTHDQFIYCNYFNSFGADFSDDLIPCSVAFFFCGYNHVLYNLTLGKTNYSILIHTYNEADLWPFEHSTFKQGKFLMIRGCGLYYQHTYPNNPKRMVLGHLSRRRVER